MIGRTLWRLMWLDTVCSARNIFKTHTFLTLTLQYNPQLRPVLLLREALGKTLVSPPHIIYIPHVFGRVTICQLRRCGVRYTRLKMWLRGSRTGIDTETVIHLYHGPRLVIDGVHSRELRLPSRGRTNQ